MTELHLASLVEFKLPYAATAVLVVNFILTCYVVHPDLIRTLLFL